MTKDLTLFTPEGSQRATLDGADAGRTLFVGEVSVTLRRLTITGGSEQFGAGISNQGTLRIIRSLVTDNHSPNGHGGGIQNSQVVVLNRTTVSGNSADGVGGGIDSSAGTLILNGSSVTENTAEWGGGIGNGQMFGSASTLTLNGSSSVSGNTATRDGGGIWIGNGTVTMNGSSSVIGNRADFNDDTNGTGGGIFNCGSPLVGATDGGNVNDNFLGSTGTTENNIVTCV